MKRSVFAAIAAACLTFVVCANVPVRAGTLPDISGTWYGNGYSSRRCQINQSGNSVSLTNEQGSTATGNFTDPSTLSTSWRIFGGGNVTGRISNDLQTITWSNGTYWTRAPQNGPAPTPTPKPYRDLNWTDPGGPKPPLDLIQTWTSVARDGSTAYSCVSFKNTAEATAAKIHFEFELLDRDRQVVDTAYLDRAGTFSPNVGIHGYASVSDWGQGNRGYRDNCVAWHPSGGRRGYAHLRYFSVRVTRIEYADQTSWPARLNF